MFKRQIFSHTGVSQKAQTAVEYMLLLTVVAAIVLVSMKTLFPRVNRSGEIFFNKTTSAIFDEGHHCGDGFCNSALLPETTIPVENALTCCVDCGGCTY